MRTGREPRFARWPFAVLAVLVGGLACSDDEPLERLFLDDFEALCDGAPCGWEQSAGEPGQARWVETIHPGEHGLALMGEVEARRTVIPAPVMPVEADAINLRATVRCDAGSELELELVYLNASGARRTTEARLRPPAGEWTLVERPLETGMLLGTATVEAVIVRKRGPGTCVMGELLIDARLFDDNSC